MRPSCLVLTTILAGCAALTGVLPGPSALRSQLSGGAAQPDSLSSGLVTDTSAIDADPPGYRVSWIKWDSGFRGSGLCIGDRIVAIDGKRIERPPTVEERQRLLPQAIGQYAEHQTWSERGVADGATVTLTVRRRADSGQGTTTLDIKGIVSADRIFDADGRRLIGPGGPQELANDGFDGAWSSWYESFVRRAQQVLDGGWQSTMDSRSTLANHLEDKQRVDFLAQHYSGPFAKAVAADFEAVRISLVGRRYDLDDAALGYRRLGDERAAQIAAVAEKGRAAFLDAHRAEMVEPFPAIDPIRGDRKRVAGKLVTLPAIGNRDWISEAGHGWLAWGDSERGYYFVDSYAPSFGRVQEAVYRYRKSVSPDLAESYAVVGRIRPVPRMLVVDGRARTGLLLDVAAATVGDHLFIDVGDASKAAPFAGEDALTKIPDAAVAKDASPKAVMDAFIAATKNGDERRWRSSFATWRAERWRDDGSVIWYPYYERNLDSIWVDSRRLILDRVYDARVVYVGDVERILPANGGSGPRVEQVLVEIDHVGKFDGEYHAFCNVAVHRQWLLQRVDGGPWRIASDHGL